MVGALGFAMPGGLLGLAIVLLIASLVIYGLGAGRVAGLTMDAAKILVTVFLVLATLAFIGNLTNA